MSVARKTTIKSFEAWIADEANERDVLDRIAGGLTLQKASIEVKQPYTCLHAWFHSTPEREALYLTARKAWADFKNDELLGKAEDCPPDRDHVAKVKLEAEVVSAASKAYHRERWGERLQVEKSVSVTVDAGLIGFAGDLLARKVRGRVIENDVSDALPSPLEGTEA